LASSRIRYSGGGYVSRQHASVCLCTYNGERYLRPLLDSLAAQTLLPTELLVGDDGSIDYTLQIVRDFAASASFPVEVVSSDRRLGPAGNLERLLVRAKGSVLFPCDQDDVWDPAKIERMVEALARSPGSGAALCNSALIDAQGRTLPGSLFEIVGLDASSRRLMEGGKAILRIAQNNVAASHALALRRSALDLVLPFGPTPHADWWMALILGATTGITVIDDRLVEYRIHETNTVGIFTPSKVPLAVRMSPSTVAVFSSRADALDAAIARVDTRPGALAPSERAALEAEVAHLRVRGSLPRKRSRRLAIVYREAVGGGYAEFGSGWRSALLDVIRKTPSGES
jgi:glycosyltransferase involved in cell wall biosynthesis